MAEKNSTSHFRPSRGNYIIGVDEVGRGPLAGPVTVCAVLIANRLPTGDLPKGDKWRRANGGQKLRDSKKLTETQREEWFRWIKEEKRQGRLHYALASVPPKAIDRMNVTAAANLAATRAILEVLETSHVHAKDVRIFLDGGLYPQLQTTHYKLSTIIKGDEKIPAVSLASIAAKVSRDRFMVRLAKRYPAYGFERHKGYGTRAHLAAIRKHGPSPHHRLTFLGKYATFNGKIRTGSFRYVLRKVGCKMAQSSKFKVQH